MHQNYQRLIEERPAYEKILKILNKEANKCLKKRLISFQSLDAKGRYELMLKEHPNVFKQFSMGDISNYLGINAATLSRLKKGMEQQ